MDVASIVIVKSAPGNTFDLRLEFPADSVAIPGLTPNDNEAPVVMVDRELAERGYERIGDWRYDVAAGYLIAEED